MRIRRRAATEAGFDVLLTDDINLSNQQDLEGRELAIAGLSLFVKHEKDAEYDHQKGPQPGEDYLPSSGYLG